MWLSAKQKQILFEAAQDRLDFANKFSYSLWVSVDGVKRDYTRHLASVELNGEEDAPAELLTARLSTRLSTDLRECYAGLDIIIEGETESVQAKAFRGWIANVSTVYQSTTLDIATGGHYLKYPIDGLLEFHGASPSTALNEAVSRIQRRGAKYDNVEIPRIDSPLINRFDDLDEIARFDTLDDIVQAVEAEAGCVLRDTPVNVCKVYPDGHSPAPVWTIEEGVDCGFGEIGVESSEEMYAFVVVVSEEEGDDVELARVAVDNHGLPVYSGAIKVIPLSSDDSTPGERAIDVAFREADRLSKRPVKLTVPTKYPVWFLERESVITVIRNELTEDGTFRRTYEMRIPGRTSGPSRGEGSVTGEARMVREEFESRVPREIDGSKSGVMAAMWGADSSGFEFFDSSLPWVFHLPDSGAVELDVDIAAEYGVTITTETEGEMEYVEVTG